VTAKPNHIAMFVFRYFHNRRRHEDLAGCSHGHGNDITRHAQRARGIGGNHYRRVHNQDETQEIFHGQKPVNMRVKSLMTPMRGSMGR
jgi:hypothetical protein